MKRAKPVFDSVSFLHRALTEAIVRERKLETRRQSEMRRNPDPYEWHVEKLNGKWVPVIGENRP